MSKAREWWMLLPDKNQQGYFVSDQKVLPDMFKIIEKSAYIELEAHIEFLEQKYDALKMQAAHDGQIKNISSSNGSTSCG